jgi:hypothetical protein
VSEAWSWTYTDSAGRAVTGEPTTETAFPTQSDAENWFGETWRELAAAGVADVSLLRDGVLVYGPMSLDAAV